MTSLMLRQEIRVTTANGSGDELHVCVYDTTGDLTGFDVDTAGNRQNAVLETFANMSKNPIAKDCTGWFKLLS